MAKRKDPKNGHEPLEYPVSLTPKLHDYLRYIGRVDGLSVPQVIRKMVENGVRHRKASDPDFRVYTTRRVA
jgi:hypothetical protein